MADAWTDAERSNLLMQIIAQVKPEKGGINWELVHVEGRTKKACQNTWGKFMAHHKQQQALGGDGEKTGSPAKATSTRKHKSKKQKKVEEKAEDSDDDLDATPPPAKKPRGRARKPKIDNDIDIPSPQTIEDVNQFAASDEEVKPKIEYAI